MGWPWSHWCGQSNCNQGLTSWSSLGSCLFSSVHRMLQLLNGYLLTNGMTISSYLKNKPKTRTTALGTFEDVLLTLSKKGLLPHCHGSISGLPLEALVPSGLSLKVYPTRSHLCTCCHRRPKMGEQGPCPSWEKYKENVLWNGGSFGGCSCSLSWLWQGLPWMFTNVNTYVIHLKYMQIPIY